MGLQKIVEQTFPDCALRPAVANADEFIENFPNG
jgi:hypothetical protein